MLPPLNPTTKCSRLDVVSTWTNSNPPEHILDTFSKVSFSNGIDKCVAQRTHQERKDTLWLEWPGWKLLRFEKSSAKSGYPYGEIAEHDSPTIRPISMAALRSRILLALSCNWCPRSQHGYTLLLCLPANGSPSSKPTSSSKWWARRVQPSPYNGEDPNGIRDGPLFLLWRLCLHADEYFWVKSILNIPIQGAGWW